MEAKVQQPQLYVSYPSPANFAPGDRELDVLANLLGNGKSSRLYKRLVYDLKIAQSVSAVPAEPAAGQQLRDHRRADARPHAGRDARGDRRGGGRRCRPSPSTRPSWSARRTRSKPDTVRSLESLLARAERLQAYNYMAGDAGFLTEDLRRYRAVDAAAVQRAAQQYLRKDGRVVITIDPNPDAPIMGRVKK